MEKGKGEAILSLILRLLGRISIREEEEGRLGNKIKILRNRGWGRISSCGELYTSLKNAKQNLILVLIVSFNCMKCDLETTDSEELKLHMMESLIPGIIHDFSLHSLMSFWFFFQNFSISKSFLSVQMEPIAYRTPAGLCLSKHRGVHILSFFFFKYS